MSLKQYLTLMTIGTLFCWLAWFFVIFRISPNGGGFMGLFSFYLSLFLAVVGTFSVLGFLVRSVILKDEEAVFRHVKHTFRQSIFVSLIIICLLIMMANSWLFWWNAALLILFFVFVEATFFTSYKENTVHGPLN